MTFPVLKAIRSFDDVKKALDAIRTYFLSTPSVGKVIISQPQTGAILSLADGTELKTTATWELGKLYGGQGDIVLNTTEFVEIKVNGIRVRLAVIK